MPIIELDRVCCGYDERSVLKDITFDVHKGEFIGIIGPNGSGKTTLLKVIDGILTSWDGNIRINGISIGKFCRENLAKIIAVVPQESRMIFPFTVFETVLMGRAPHLGKWRFEGEKDLRIASRAMEMTDTISLMDRNINALSGGERQRVFIARALAQQPDIMLLDEPTAFLDIRHQIDFFDLIRKLNIEEALTVVIATHDINMASLYCDRIILLKSGLIHSAGSPKEVITTKNIMEVYETNASVDINPVTSLPRVTLLSSYPSEGGSRFDSGTAPQL